MIMLNEETDYICFPITIFSYKAKVAEVKASLLFNEEQDF